MSKLILVNPGPGASVTVGPNTFPVFVGRHEVSKLFPAKAPEPDPPLPKREIPEGVTEYQYDTALAFVAANPNAILDAEPTEKEKAAALKARKVLATEAEKVRKAEEAEKLKAAKLAAKAEAKAARKSRKGTRLTAEQKAARKRAAEDRKATAALAAQEKRDLAAERKRQKEAQA